MILVSENDAEYVFEHLPAVYKLWEIWKAAAKRLPPHIMKEITLSNTFSTGKLVIFDKVDDITYRVQIEEIERKPLKYPYPKPKYLCPDVYEDEVSKVMEEIIE